jgi:pyridoxal phosphate enzyme (YggS family)
MPPIETNLDQIRERIARAESRFNRAPGSVRLLAVSKTRSVGEVLSAIKAGQRRFGESYVQEALTKISQLADWKPEWHFIGPIQSNKTKIIAEHFDWVHSIDRLKVAQRLNDQRAASLAPLNVCIQVNTSGEASKSGVLVQDLSELAHALSSLPRLVLRGLMTIPAPQVDFDAQREPFRALRTAFEQLRAGGLPLDTLSMGMTDDMEAAIAEGATIVRIGTAVFGERPTKQAPE